LCGAANRCLDDVDDEVRDRAAMYLKVLKEEPLAEKLVKDGTHVSPPALRFGDHSNT
jgi:coatomer protein complex subunit gamma